MPTPARKPLLRSKPIEFQLEVFKLAEQYLDIQSQFITALSKFKFAELSRLSIRGEDSLQEIFAAAVDTGPFNPDQWPKEIKASIEDLERQDREQKEISELLRECGDLSEAAKKVEREEWPGTEGPTAKRRLEDHDKLEEHVLKVLKACKRLKGTE